MAARRRRVVWSAQAAHALDDAVGYVAQDSVAAARRLLAEASQRRRPSTPSANAGPSHLRSTIPRSASSAIIDVELQDGDAADAHGLAARVLAAEGRLNEAMGDPVDVARVQAIVGDMGYCDATELSQLQAVGIRTAIADPVHNRQWEKLPEAERRAPRTAQRTTRSASGRALVRRRGEMCERSFVHVFDYGGARRTPLRGWENIRKRYVIQAACANLALLLRHQSGIGTLKQSWAASEAALGAVIALLCALLHQQLGHRASTTLRASPVAASALGYESGETVPPDRSTSTVC
jgi:hypothetical protein